MERAITRVFEKLAGPGWLVARTSRSVALGGAGVSLLRADAYRGSDAEQRCGSKSGRTEILGPKKPPCAADDKRYHYGDSYVCHFPPSSSGARIA